MSSITDLNVDPALEPWTNQRDKHAERAAAVSRTSGYRSRPLQVTWEVTNSLHWKPVPAKARAARDFQQFSTAEGFHLIDQIAEMHVPLLAITGGDPLSRPDLLPIIEFASERSVRTSLTLIPAAKLDVGVMTELKACGLMRVVFWLNGSSPGLNDRYWGIPGLYRRTMEAIGLCHEVQLPVQVNTMVSRRNLQDLDAMIELLARLDVSLWNVFFFVPPKREDSGEMLNADEHEQAFAKLYAVSRRANFQIKTTEGQQYQRFLLQQRVRESRGRLTVATAVPYAPRGVNDGKGFAFISSRGEVYPSRFLPLSGGNVTKQSLPEIYCESELFVSLRDVSKLKGKCGRCPARTVCGGSRARSYVMTGDLFASDPCCAYEP
jgi:radical SAM protein with 4Fe4S-binding SPASM domain